MGCVSVHGEWFDGAALFGRVRLGEALLVVGEGFDLPWLAGNPYKVADFGHGELTALDWLLVERISHEGRDAVEVVSGDIGFSSRWAAALCVPVWCDM